MDGAPASKQKCNQARRKISTRVWNSGLCELRQALNIFLIPHKFLLNVKPECVWSYIYFFYFLVVESVFLLHFLNLANRKFHYPNLSTKWIYWFDLWMSQVNLNLLGDWIFAASFQWGLITAGLQRNASKKKRRTPGVLWPVMRLSSGVVPGQWCEEFLRFCGLRSFSLQEMWREPEWRKIKPRRPAAHDLADLAMLLRKGCARTHTSRRY